MKAESWKLKCGDIVLENDAETGNQVLIWISERASKTRRGNGDRPAFNTTAQATNNERCPVVYHNKFRSSHPVNLSQAAVNPKEPFAVFSGACIGKIEGCSFTFNIHHEAQKEKNQ